jgi:hypothetical protein
MLFMSKPTCTFRLTWLASASRLIAAFTVWRSREDLCSWCPRRLRKPLLALILGGFASLSHAIPTAERQFLIDLYTSANGPGWNTGTNWNGAVGTECTWFGITCSSGNANVTIINLSTNNLIGTLPTTLNSLTALQLFDVNNNQLTGAIPSLANLSALQVFNIGFNQLTGAIPPLAGLTALQVFYANNNQLVGVIPPLAGLTALQVFDVGINQLVGAIPSLAGLTALQIFYVSFNQLTGAIPPLTGLAALQYFSVVSNQLTGAIPPLAGLTALQVFRVENNQLTDSIPPVPSPTNSLTAGGSALCPNQLTVSVDVAWDAATGSTPWSTGCTAALVGQALNFGAPPTLAAGGAGTVVATPTPLPGSANSIVYSSLTPLVCSVNANSGLVTVLPAALAGDVCTIAADKAGDATHNSAPQAIQSIAVTAVAANCRLNINGDAALSADIDGMLILRYMLGFRGDALIDGLTPLVGTRTTAGAIESFLAVQDFGVTVPATPMQATRDGFVIARFIQGLLATAMIAGTDIPPADADDVRNLIQGWCP